MTGEEKPWKEASSLILVSKCDLNGRKDFRILLTERSAKSSFLASAYCFPGGHVEPDDFSSQWLSVFANCGVNRDELKLFSESISGPRPPIIEQSITKEILINQGDNDAIASDIGLRIAAIRETFEETGILLVKRNDNTRKMTPTNEVNEWRKKVHQNARYFREMCNELKSIPDIWSLTEWWNWLTPQSLGHRRFDTMFYLACVDKQPESRKDNDEVSRIRWLQPNEILDGHQSKKIFLAPPQVYEMSRLESFNDFASLKKFSHDREILGCNRWSPVMTGFKDGVLLAFPGDDYFDSKFAESAATITTSLNDNRSKATNLNRIEMRAPICSVHCNITLNCGHRRPVTYTGYSSQIHSLL